ncbi:MAG: 30S ribosomal protein S6 [Candidatus Omnitrophota bacterium]|nr:30S ribosomal protein S6 [Candidatus Omnitrophota bacterium]
MRNYEGIFVFLPNITEEVKKEQENALDALVKKFEGKIILKTDWGKRQLGHPIRKSRDVFMVLWDFDMEPAKMVGFRKALELSQDVIKFTVSLKDPRLEEQKKNNPAPKISELAVESSNPVTR